MREVDIAMAMIVQVDQYHLQKRTGPKAIGAAGLVGCFGGKIDDGESPKEAIIRELPEETNIIPAPERVIGLDEFQVDSDHQHEPVKVNVTAFKLLIPHGFKVEAREGELVTWSRNELEANQSELTPATKELFRRIFEWR